MLPTIVLTNRSHSKTDEMPISSFPILFVPAGLKDLKMKIFAV
jgi:hypothetical protein